MKSYGIIRKQPQWVNIIRVMATQQIDPQITIDHIKHPKIINQVHVVPKRCLSVDSSIHVIPKHYNPREVKEVRFKRKSIFEKSKHEPQLPNSNILDNLKNISHQSNPISQSDSKMDIILPQDQFILNEQMKNPEQSKIINNSQSIIDKIQKQQLAINSQSIPIINNTQVKSKITNNLDPLGQSKIILQNQSHGQKQEIQHMHPFYIKRPIFSKSNKIQFAQALENTKYNQIKSQKQKQQQDNHQQNNKISKLSLTNHIVQWKIEGRPSQPLSDQNTHNFISSTRLKEGQSIKSNSQASKTAQKAPKFVQNDQHSQRGQLKNSKLPRQEKQRQYIKRPIQKQQRINIQESIIQKMGISSKRYSEISQQNKTQEPRQRNMIESEPLYKSVQIQQSSPLTEQIKFKKVIGLKKRKNLPPSKQSLMQQNKQQKNDTIPVIHKLKSKSSMLKQQANSKILSQSFRSQSSSIVSIQVYKVLQMSAFKI